jgi:hypothetical protein
MKAEYLAYRDELIEEALSHYSQPRHTISVPYLLKGRCIPWAQKFVDRWPNLKLVKGFWRGLEHAWCVDENGDIVDPTIGQFIGMDQPDGLPADYREVDWQKDRIYLGKCMNCGDEIYGLRARGHQSVCSDECNRSLELYYNSEIAAYRAGA